MRAETEAFFAACPELGAYDARLSSTALAPAVRLAVRAHLCEPTTAAAALSAMAGVSLGDVRAAYQFFQHDPDTHALVGSLFYPHRLRWTFAAAAVKVWAADPLGFERLAAGEAVLSKTVEIHPSKGTCNYACAMCLWSDKQTLTYAERGLTADGLLSTQDWRRVLGELRQGGAATLVLSGGGEVLLNREIPEILRCAERWDSGSTCTPPASTCSPKTARCGTRWSWWTRRGSASTRRMRPPTTRSPACPPG